MQEALDNILHAILGKDVRQSLYYGIKQNHEDTEKNGQKIETINSNKIDKPDKSDNGLVPRAKDGNVEWVAAGQPTDEQVQTWLDQHPEATTSVQDYSLGINKMMIGTLGYVTPEMFGAVGDNKNDDTPAFQKAIETGLPIICAPNKRYYFKSIINARKQMCICLDGNNSYFRNFCIELYLKDDSYTNRGGTSLNWLLSIFKNMRIGTDSWNKTDDNPCRPSIICGCAVRCENITMYGHYPLVAYTHTYIDTLQLNNITYLGGAYDVSSNSEKNEICNTNCIMFVSEDGTFHKYNTYTQGDDWVFENVKEAHFSNDENDNQFGLVSLNYNHNVRVESCINPVIFVGAHTEVGVNECHFESDSGLIFRNERRNGYYVGTICKFSSCYFYGMSKYPVSNRCFYDKCVLDIRFEAPSDNALYFRNLGKNLLKDTNIIDCLFGYSHIVNSRDLNYPRNNNYLYLNEFFDARDIECRTNSGNLNGNYNLKIYVIRMYDEKIYSYLKEYTGNLKDECFYFKIVNCTPCQVVGYLTNKETNKIYKFETVIDDSCMFEVNINSHCFDVNIDQRESDNYHKARAYPMANTLEEVDSIPVYAERADLYCLGDTQCVSDNDNTGFTGKYVRLSKGTVTKGNGY